MAEVPGRIAKRWRRETDLRDERGGSFGDCSGVGARTPVSGHPIRPKPRSRRPKWTLTGGWETFWCCGVLYQPRKVRPRCRRQPEANAAPQVDWGSLSYIGADGKQRRVWVFVMTLGWSRACRGTGAQGGLAFIHATSMPSSIWAACPASAFTTMPRSVTLGRDEATDLEPADAGFRPAGGF